MPELTVDYYMLIIFVASFCLYFSKVNVVQFRLDRSLVIYASVWYLQTKQLID